MKIIFLREFKEVLSDGELKNALGGSNSDGCSTPYLYTILGGDKVCSSSSNVNTYNIYIQ
jgi:hypothetical protein